MEMTLEERKEMALRLRAEGYNCAQSVIMVFEDVTGLPADVTAPLTSGLGSGVASGEICGVANAMALVQGSRQPADAKAKTASSRASRCLLDRFSAENGGRLRCVDLKGKEGSRPCNDLVLQGVEILHEYLNSHEV